MGHSTLETMQRIEAAAQAVLDDYAHEADKQEKSFAQELLDIGAAFDQETEQEVTALQVAVKEKLSALRAKSEETKALNENRAQTILADKKEELTRRIIDKVVETYGN